MGRKRDLYDRHMDDTVRERLAWERWWLTPISKRRRRDEPLRGRLLHYAATRSGASVMTTREATPWVLAFFAVFFAARAMERMEADGLPWERFATEEVRTCR
ncbi:MULTISPECIES: hypothetical protein [unclassified Agrococcus]|uniref:hypothetical protein n=1 Tax=unclassified Agrococcus TaxID=2615065 RepID=UPI003622552F